MATGCKQNIYPTQYVCHSLLSLLHEQMQHDGAKIDNYNGINRSCLEPTEYTTNITLTYKLLESHYDHSEKNMVAL